jgi:hypothetical protein
VLERHLAISGLAGLPHHAARSMGRLAEACGQSLRQRLWRAVLHAPWDVLPLGAAALLDACQLRSPHWSVLSRNLFDAISSTAPARTCRFPGSLRPLGYSSLPAPALTSWEPGQSGIRRTGSQVMSIVRRQSFWDTERLKIRESLAPQVYDVKQLAVGAASGDWQLSVV